MMSSIKMGLQEIQAGSIYKGCRGLPRPTELMMLGNTLQGEEALRIGMTTKLVNKESLHEETYKLAAALANSPLAAI